MTESAQWADSVKITGNTDIVFSCDHCDNTYSIKVSFQSHMRLDSLAAAVLETEQVLKDEQMGVEKLLVKDHDLEWYQEDNNCVFCQKVIC